MTDDLKLPQVGELTIWLHVFKNGSVCATEETYYVVSGRIACIKVELNFEEGEGL
jgi:hypothetical protein